MSHKDEPKESHECMKKVQDHTNLSLFKQRIEKMFKESGTTWLQQLPTLTAALAIKWHLSDLVEANNLSYNFIMLGYQDTKPVALKISYDRESLQREIGALKAYQGNGCVQLLAYDMSSHALLIECARPGHSLARLFPDHDDKAVEHAVTVMQQLHKADVTTDVYFPRIEEWLQDLEHDYPTTLESYHINKARILARHLNATQANPVLLHGDLHHDNILAQGHHWLAIDPKGVIGEPAYEAGAFVRNPLPNLLQHNNAQAIMYRRLTIFSQLLGINQQRLCQWSYVQAVLSCCWAYQDGSLDTKMVMAEAALLDAIMDK